MKNKTNILIFLFIILFVLINSLVFLNKNRYIDNFESNKDDYLKEIDKIYWINLDRSSLRRKKMENMFKDEVFKDIDIERISAVDGTSTNIDNILKNNFKNQNKNQTKIEHAVLLSHLNIIKNFYFSNYNIALIMEDDMTLEYKPYWKESIQNIIINAPSDWEIIMLAYNYQENVLSNKYTKAGANDTSIACAGAYIINKKGAHKINNLYKNNKFDLNIDLQFEADHYIFTELITYAYKYPYFTYPYENDSTIHPDHISGHNKSKRIIEKYIYKINQDDID